MAGVHCVPLKYAQSAPEPHRVHHPGTQRAGRFYNTVNKELRVVLNARAVKKRNLCEDSEFVSPY